MITDIIKREFIIPTEKPSILLKSLLELNLHLHANDIDEITEKAIKEAKHEDTLKNLETVWSNVNFSMTFYKDTDVPLVKLDDDMIEQLESDQMAVQSIVSSRYGFFKNQAVEWQKTLSLINDIYTLLTEIQRTWSYLEPLFIGSEEVRKELPEDAKRFQGKFLCISGALINLFRASAFPLLYTSLHVTTSCSHFTSFSPSLPLCRY
jgi:dynein heavy chain